jgi:hypothetical protein
MGRSPPIRSKRDHLKLATHPALRCGRGSSQQRSENGYSETSSPVSRLGSSPFGTVCPVLLLVRMRGDDFSL